MLRRVILQLVCHAATDVVCVKVCGISAGIMLMSLAYDVLPRMRRVLLHRYCDVVVVTAVDGILFGVVE